MLWVIVGVCVCILTNPALWSQLMEHTIAGIEDLCGQWSHFYWKDKWDLPTYLSETSTFFFFFFQWCLPLSAVAQCAMFGCGVMFTSQARLVFNLPLSSSLSVGSLKRLRFLPGACKQILKGHRYFFWSRQASILKSVLHTRWDCNCNIQNKISVALKPTRKM